MIQARLHMKAGEKKEMAHFEGRTDEAKDFFLKKREENEGGMDIPNEREGVRRTEKGEKDPPLSEESRNKSLHFSSVGGASVVQMNRLPLLCLLLILFSLVFVTPKMEREKMKKEGMECRNEW